VISIDRSQINPPEIPKPETFEKNVNKLLEEKGKHRFNERYIGLICDDLKELYVYKCGYCETYTGAGSVLHFDHYRPKNGVKGTSHQGYYWLGYEWTNFVPACFKCNRTKSNWFPIAGEEDKRVKEPPLLPDGRLDKSKCMIHSPELEAEMPLLLHPEVDKPEKHLVFLSSGGIESVTTRGEKTIEICGLNREGLILERREIIDGYLDDIREILDDFIAGEIDRKTMRYDLDRLFKKISESGNPKKPYSRMGWYMFHDFDSFFIEPLGPKQQQILRKAIKLFKEYGSIRKKKTN
jgi:5-methylcytosine-specific restriction endonuclease McrA